MANRGEIPIRIFRTAHELSLHTVAVFSYEDRLGMHRQKADEAYLIGKRGQYTPVGAYLAGDEIIKIALQHEVNMIHPGYGFLSENAEFARKVEQAGLIVSGTQAISLSVYHRARYMLVALMTASNHMSSGLFHWSSKTQVQAIVLLISQLLCVLAYYSFLPEADFKSGGSS